MCLRVIFRQMFLDKQQCCVIKSQPVDRPPPGPPRPSCYKHIHIHVHTRNLQLISLGSCCASSRGEKDTCIHSPPHTNTPVLLPNTHTTNRFLVLSADWSKMSVNILQGFLELFFFFSFSNFWFISYIFFRWTVEFGLYFNFFWAHFRLLLTFDLWPHSLPVFEHSYWGETME